MQEKAVVFTNFKIHSNNVVRIHKNERSFLSQIKESREKAAGYVAGQNAILLSWVCSTIVVYVIYKASLKTLWISGHTLLGTLLFVLFLSMAGLGVVYCHFLLTSPKRKLAQKTIDWIDTCVDAVEGENK